MEIIALGGHEHKYDDVRGKGFFGQTRREVLPHGAAYPSVDYVHDHLVRHGLLFNMIDWNIQSPAHACQACEKPFVAREPYHTLLFDERHGYVRLDVCEACWEAQYRHGASDRKGFVSHWLGQYAPPPAAAPEPIPKETAESLLRRLIETNDHGHQRACYILAVMLERKRLLKVQSQFFRDGQRVFIYEQPKTGDIFTIVDPNVELSQVDELQREVAHLLEHGLHPPSEHPKSSGAIDEIVLANTSDRRETIESPASEQQSPMANANL